MRLFIRSIFLTGGMILMCFGTTLQAQQRQTLFEQINLEEVVTSSSVLSMICDPQGFMWFGTYEGLVRYNGYDLWHIQSSPTDTFCISSDRVFKVMADKAGDIWIASWEGVDRFSHINGRVYRYDMIQPGNSKPTRNFSQALYQDHEGRIWAGTRLGVTRLNPKNQLFEYIVPVDEKGEKYSKGTNYDFYENSKGELMIANQMGVSTFSKDLKHFRHQFVNPLDSDEYAHRRVYVLFNDSKKRLWAVTGGGLYQYDEKNDRYMLAPIPDKELIHAALFCMVEDADGALWLGYQENGLARWNPETGALERFQRSEYNRQSLISNNINSLCFDHNGNLWVGSGNGLQKFNPAANQFQFYQIGPEKRTNEELNSIDKVYRDRRGGIWMGTMQGTYFASKLGAPAQLLSNFPNEYFVEGYQEDLSGRMWFGVSSIPGRGAGGGLLRRDSPQSKVVKLQYDGMSDVITVYDFQPDQKDSSSFWLSDGEGLCHLKKSTLDTFWYYPSSNPLIRSDAVRKICQAESGMIYLGSDNGLVRFNRKTAGFDIFTNHPSDTNSLVGNYVRKVIEGKPGILWIATNSGLSRMDEKTGAFRNFTIGKGLAGGNIVFDLVRDLKGRVWFMTNGHISCFDESTQSFRHYSNADGFNTNFSRLSAFCDDAGNLYFGGQNGLVVFHPDSLKTIKTIPRVVLSGLRVLDKPYNTGVLTENVKKIVLKYSENIISFEFAALEMIYNGRNQFAYRLKDFDPDWVYNGTERKATYTNLDPGHYVFQVKTTNFSGQWSEQPALSIEVVIMPPYWKTGWFKLLLGLIIGVIAYLLYRNAQHQRALRQQKEIAEQATRYKSQFLANMSHEVRTPMNAILGLSRLLLGTPLEGKQRQFAEVIQQSSENLVVIINDILDHSKIESGKITFVKRPFNLELLFNQIREMLKYRAQEKGLRFELDIAPDTPIYLEGDSTRLYQILMNLAGNALKFTESGGVAVDVRCLQKTAAEVSLQFEVRDTGIGIAPDQIDRIFDSFEQGDADIFNRFGGTGLGLTITRQLIEQQGGKIEVESELGKGSVFRFFLRFAPSTEMKEIEATAQEIVYPAGLRVLVVDDTYFNQLLAVELIRSKIPDAHIELADNGLIALEKIRHQPYDLVLMDVKMPVMGGFEAARAIRKMEPPLNGLPIIALTANAVPDELKACTQAGMNAVITKPIDSRQLFETIIQLMDNC